MSILFIYLSKAQRSLFDTYPVYKNADLGLRYTPKQSTFKIWAPTAESAELILYDRGVDGKEIKRLVMSKTNNGTWTSSIDGDQQGKFYAFRVKINGDWKKEIPDPYAKAVGVNGKRGAIIELKKTDPLNWNIDKGPGLKNPTDAIIYELHVRDASISVTSGIRDKGKFIGLIEESTINSSGLSSGLDHIKEMGITHLHLLPSFDFYSIDESKPGIPQYNWGYDPLNYNVPEGSYSTDANNPETRIREFKKLIQTLHRNGLGVVMDVVYNHTRLSQDSYFNELVPGYYYRQGPDGKFSNATACGNETASERYMMRKFILESVIYWAKEYHIDGFRFDLMGIHDIETMNLISKELHKINPNILIYGEGWTAGTSPLPDSLLALKRSAYKLDKIAVFSDDIRDGIKGSVFDHHDKGFVSGKKDMEESIKFGIVAATKHPQIDYTKVNYSKAPYAAAPWNTINYASCHDNHTLWDKLTISASDASEKSRVEMQKLALTIVLTSQGIPFLHAGTEFLRSKNGVENSFESPDSINAINWDLKTKNRGVVEYIKSIIKIRKEHPAFRLSTTRQITSSLSFYESTPPGTVAYELNGQIAGDKWKKIFVGFNGSGQEKNIKLKSGKWKTAVLNNVIRNEEPYFENNITLLPYSCVILYQD